MGGSSPGGVLYQSLNWLAVTSDVCNHCHLGCSSTLNTWPCLVRCLTIWLSLDFLFDRSYLRMRGFFNYAWACLWPGSLCLFNKSLYFLIFCSCSALESSFWWCLHFSIIGQPQLCAVQLNFRVWHHIGNVGRKPFAETTASQSILRRTGKHASVLLHWLRTAIIYVFGGYIVYGLLMRQHDLVCSLLVDLLVLSVYLGHIWVLVLSSSSLGWTQSMLCWI